ncbi:hypothetical protein PROFUN_08062 [Planoprotostelium fungivorum]|uniref:CUE domain-containing protein n=1 Tax=Planoprotostelium fungivorum TaxID=1890364 RepID=A0A2P6NKI3_9EUKA|nr:hypothetical protein PROFUN_08062 [Planoprotostelium fungivorum]
MANFGALMRLTVMFPDADHDELEQILIDRDNHFSNTVKYLTEVKRWKVDDTAAEAMKESRNQATAQSVTASAGVLRLQKEFPHIDIDFLNGTIKAFGGDVDKVRPFIQSIPKETIQRVRLEKGNQPPSLERRQVMFGRDTKESPIFNAIPHRRYDGKWLAAASSTVNVILEDSAKIGLRFMMPGVDMNITGYERLSDGLVVVSNEYESWGLLFTDGSPQPFLNELSNKLKPITPSAPPMTESDYERRERVQPSRNIGPPALPPPRQRGTGGVTCSASHLSDAEKREHERGCRVIQSRDLIEPLIEEIERLKTQLERSQEINLC